MKCIKMNLVIKCDYNIQHSQKGFTKKSGGLKFVRK